MDELIRIKVNEKQEQVVDGRELHKVLEVSTAYKDWFPRMCEYGFTEGEDFCSILSESTGGRPATNHLVSIDMAKELCMIQRTERGKQARQYFIQVEKDYNSPEKIMARALRIAEQELSTLRLENKVKDQQIAELTPKATYYDLILQCKDLLTVTEISKDYGMSAKGLNTKLHELGVQYRQSSIWFLYSKYQDKGYTQTKTQSYTKSDGMIGSSVHTYWTQKGRLFLYDLLKENGILPMIEKEKEDA